MEIADTGSQPTGLADAAKAIESLLDGIDETPADKPKDEPDAAGKQPSSAQGDGEKAASDDEQETSDDAAGEDQGDGAGDEDEAAAEDEEQESAEGELPKTVTVTIDGKTEQVPLDEVVKGYQRQADYSRKTAKLADERREFEADRQNVVQERAQYAHLLKALEARLNELAPQEPDWQKLYAEDPVEALRLKDAWRDHKEQLAAIEAEKQRVEELEGQERAKAFNARVQESQRKLVEYEPAWADKARWKVDSAKIKAYAIEKLGYTAEELKNANDHRALIAVHKAMKLDELMANRPKPNAKPKGGVKPLAPNSSARTPRPVTAQTRAKQRLAKTGSVRDAAVVFEGLLD